MFGFSSREKLEKLFAGRNFKEAAIEASKLLKGSPDDSQLLGLRAMCYTRTKDYGGALKDVYLGLSRDPSDPDLGQALAAIYDEMGYPEAAVAIHARAVEKEPSFSGLYNYAILLEKVKRYGEAMSVFKRLDQEHIPGSDDDSEAAQECRAYVMVKIHFPTDLADQERAKAAVPEIIASYKRLAEAGKFPKPLNNPQAIMVHGGERGKPHSIFVKTTAGNLEGKVSLTKPEWVFELKPSDDEEDIAAE